MLIYQSNRDIPKYRCPRCSLRTCSLACSKRHKTWSQCSGVRNPTSYVKRADLVTPAGIDRDFNFIVGIERHLEQADQEAERRGIDLDGPDEAPWRRKANREKNAGKIAKAISRCGVILHKVPTGMQRERDNHTHWNSKHGCLVWTIEWATPDACVLGSIQEKINLETAYKSLQGQRQGLARKRKRSDSNAPQSRDTRSRRDLQAPQATPETHTEMAVEDSEPSAQKQYFYLLRPFQVSGDRVLVPLSSSPSMSQCLQQQVIVEFPTIYVLPNPPAALPNGYRLEKTHGKSSAHDESLLDMLHSFTNTEVGSEGVLEQTAGAPDVKVDQLASVLDQDLRSLVADV
ncbi:MAG: hypothetical protein M1817_005521 [Caeruleum heppii]|nr:MAG: hypothetical protein M1817_005521 [Caeruleum heppii]